MVDILSQEAAAVLVCITVVSGGTRTVRQVETRGSRVKGGLFVSYRMSVPDAQ